MADGDISTQGGAGHNSEDAQLRLFMERLDRLEEEKKGIADDIRDTYSEAKAVGYDTKMMRETRRWRKMSPADRVEYMAMLETYAAAIGIPL